MGFDNERLPALIQQIERKSEVNNKIRELSIERGPINKQVLKLEFELEQALKREKDLEKGGITTFFLSISGKLEQMRNAAYDEVRSIRSEYDTAAYKLNSIDSSIACVQNELESIIKCEKEYTEAFAEKVEAIKASDHPEKEQVICLDDDLALMQEHISFFKSTRSFANEVRKAADYILFFNNSTSEVSFVDVMTMNHHKLRQAIEEERDHKRSLQEMKKESFEQLVEFEKRLVVVSEVAENYSDVGFIRKCLGVISKIRIENYNAKIIAEEMSQLSEGLDRVVEKVNNNYSDVKKVFDELVLRIRL